ncbi:MAG TPA: hypothetical protein VM142_11585 [Acidimicrobiales bacterium]|nr:hypothetical protein [Acidimicrobiales bacterium]
MTLPHLNDEQLSAHLDGEDHDATGHLGSCGECEGRLASLLLVSSLVGGAVPDAPDDAREAAVQAARKAWEAVDRSEGESDRAEEAEVTSLERRRRVPRWVLPIAAAAAALLIAVPVVQTLRDDEGAGQSAVPLEDRGAAGGPDAESTGVDGGDLGEQSDPAGLARAIRGALPGAASEAALAAPAPPVAGGTTATGERDTSGPPTSAAMQAEPYSPNAVTKTGRFGERPCADVVRTSYGQGLGPLVYTALVSWQGTPAVVLAYRLADAGAPGLDYRVLVMARQDCRLLVGQSL